MESEKQTLPEEEPIAEPEPEPAAQPVPDIETAEPVNTHKPKGKVKKTKKPASEGESRSFGQAISDFLTKTFTDEGLDE